MSAFESWRLENGLRVLYQRDSAFPLTCATLLFGVGSRFEMPDQAGLCSMTLDLLMQGTRHRTARELASVMESVGASMGTQVHEDYAEMGFVVPSTELDRAFGVMAEVLKEPVFPRGEIIKEKAHVLAGLSSRKDAIFDVAYDSLNNALYGKHPYGRPLEGHPGTVRSFKRADFQRWHQKRFRPEQAVLAFTGSLSASEVARRLQKTLGTWRAAGGISAVMPAKAGTQSIFWAPSHSFQDIGRDSPLLGTASAGMTALVSRIRKSIFGLHEIWKDCRKKYPLYRYPYHGLNWVLTDGKTLIAMCYVNPGGFGKAKALGDRRQPYYQLQLSITPEEVYVASEPFDSTRPWKAMRHGELVIARRMKESVEIERQTL